MQYLFVKRITYGNYSKKKKKKILLLPKLSHNKFDTYHSLIFLQNNTILSTLIIHSTPRPSTHYHGGFFCRLIP